MKKVQRIGSILKKVRLIALIIASLLCGFMIFSVWTVGSYGHFNLNLHHGDSWLIICGLSLFWGVPAGLLCYETVKWTRLKSK